MNKNDDMELMEIQSLNYSYDEEKKTLKDINLKIYEGEKIAILGANGAGKSTFFLNINGVLTPDSGRIIYRGKEIGRKNINELRKRVGIVFQDADSQIIAPTVLSEVSFGPMNLKLSRDTVKDRTYRALDYMNLMQLKDRPPHYLSGGEKKRVSIADIIAMEPEVIIFDEPTASLDPFNIKLLEELLERLEEEGKTIIVSTHDVDFAYRFASRLLVFKEGEIVCDGEPISIFKDKDLLKISNLTSPVMMDMYEFMVEKKIIEDNNLYPKTISQFKEILDKR